MSLIATPNIDNVNRRQEEGKFNYKLCVICMQKGREFVFANYMDNVLVQTSTMGGFKKGEWWECFMS